jgi:uncharacterized protein
MARQYFRTMFTDQTRALQQADGSRNAYARMEANDADVDVLGERELDFIAASDSFYIASITADGWPYVQHRGGATGFLRDLGNSRLGFADFRGNRQHVSEANLANDPRVSLFLMDYPQQRRLKLIGHATMLGMDGHAELADQLNVGHYDATTERLCVIDIVGFDWNCPQHITPRFTEAQARQAVAPLHAEIRQLRDKIAAMVGHQATP